MVKNSVDRNSINVLLKANMEKNIVFGKRFYAQDIPINVYK